MAVDRKYDVEIDGQGYVLDRGRYSMEFDDGFLAPRLVTDNGGEAPAGSFWWQRRFSDWSAGYNQKFSEAEDSSPNRFLDSSGVDVSTSGEFKLLPATAVSRASASTNLVLYTALSKLWMTDGTNVYHTTDGSSWTGPVATGVTGNIAAITDDGTDLYVFGTSGNIRKGSTGAYANFYEPVNPRHLLWHNGSLYGDNGRYLAKITSSGHTNLNADQGAGWNARHIIEHQRKIVFAAKKGSDEAAKTYIWESDGTSGGTTILVDDIPNGFSVYGLFSYSDILWIYGGWETTAGSASQGGIYAFTQGQLRFIGRLEEMANVGEASPAASPVIDTIPRVAFAFGQFVFFGMQEGTGLWRYDLKEGGFSRYITVAGAGNNLVTGATWFKGKEYLAYSGGGTFARTATFLSSGWIKQSATTLGHSNPKVGRAVILGLANKTAATTTYTADDLPAASTPAWSKTTVGAGQSESVSGGILTTAATGASEQYYEIDDASLATATGSTIEARLQIVSGPTELESTSSLRIEDGTNKVMLWITKDALRIVNDIAGFNGKQIEWVADDNFHTYRLTLKGTAVNVYVDGSLRLSHTTTGTSANQTITFGDPDGSNVAHNEQWDYVRYWNNGAHEPGGTTFSSNPLVVEFSEDGGSTFLTLTADDTFKNYDLSALSHWQDSIIKVTLSNSDAVIKDISIEAAPKLPIFRKWEMALDLYSDMDTKQGASERIDTQVVYEALEAARISGRPVAFKGIDFDIATNPVIRNVLIEKLKRGRVEVIDTEVENIIELRLREI